VAVHEQDLAELRRRRARHRVKRASERAAYLLQTIVAFGGLIVVILVSIPWLRGPLEKVGFTAQGSLAEVIITVVVVSIFFEVRKLADARPTSGRRHFTDPMAVYPVLLERVHATTRHKEKVLDVLGLTLFTAWPSIRFWLNGSELNGWTVRFTALMDDGGQLSKHVPKSCFENARNNLDSIAQYAASATARVQNVTVRPFAYDFMPSLHGYRLGNGDLFYSIVHWEHEMLSLDDFSYEFVPHEDHSESAQAIRDVFDSWFQRGITTSWDGQPPN
jgi:hypothetical protein